MMNSGQKPIDFSKSPEENRNHYLSDNNIRELALLPPHIIQEVLTKSLCFEQLDQVRQQLEKSLEFRAELAKEWQHGTNLSLMPTQKIVRQILYDNQQPIISLEETIQSTMQAFARSMVDAMDVQVFMKSLANIMDSQRNMLRNSLIQFSHVALNLFSLSGSRQFSEYERIDNSIECIDEKKGSLAIRAKSIHTFNCGKLLFYEDQYLIRLEFHKESGISKDVTLFAREVWDNLQPLNNKSKKTIKAKKMLIRLVNSNLYIGSRLIKVTPSSKQATLARFFAVQPEENLIQQWDIQDIVEQVFGEHIHIKGEKWWINSIRQYIYHLNLKIKLATNGEIKDFFIKEGLHIYINKKYVNS